MGSETLKPDRRPPYTVRLMAGLADVFHIVARDGWSIIATCYERQEADGLARSANAFEPMREALAELGADVASELGMPEAATEALVKVLEDFAATWPSIEVPRETLVRLLRALRASDGATAARLARLPPNDAAREREADRALLQKCATVLNRCLVEWCAGCGRKRTTPGPCPHCSADGRNVSTTADAPDHLHYLAAELRAADGETEGKPT